ncbi:MAG TPA: SDR family oxidoreductase [Chitinophagaceae bacterium]|jgi:short-subunit dehydrogenase|nr:SDR family oxidoreductase [Chitinophagaceae bacterium]
MSTNNPPLKDRGPNIVITGASRGLGKAIAEIFAANGHNLYLTAMHEARLYKATEELLSKYPTVTIKAKPFDLSKKEQVQAFGEWCLKNCSPDILVNNAGSFTGANVHDEEDGALEEMIETNLYSAYHLTRVIVKAMIEKKSGHIFNMSSIAGLKAYPGGGSYSISKFALRGFSVNLREELKSYNIKVTTVFPGAAYTDSWASSGIEKRRFMEASDIAKMVYAASQLSPQACVEDIILRPQLGDI